MTHLTETPYGFVPLTITEPPVPEGATAATGE